MSSKMDSTKRKALKAAGWKFGDAEDFLEMSPAERQLLEARVKIAQAIQQQRKSKKISQKELGSRLKTSQPRIAKIEQAAPDVSLDQLVRAFSAVGGRIVVRTRKSRKGKSQSTEQMELEISTSE